MARRNTSEVNAGSMADIAFLLLIFFLVTTTIDKDKGIFRQLPPDKTENEGQVSMRNIMVVNINSDGELLVNQELLPVSELAQQAIDFIDNGGIIEESSDLFCDYCEGVRDATSSDHPKKAVIAITSNRDTKYGDYIAVQNIITSAYNTLRDRTSQQLYGWDFTEIQAQVKAGSYDGNLEKVKSQLNRIKDMYPMIITETETKQRI
ncbi:biopolymer transporter ExbD [Dokdonia sinensis]|uniref:Biopolymer transporter ExbD n=1 Tax=Dokdonia sinensis TaxID=2479847 RepID=A0A3M0G1U7_9FLAO|nr:biopolymer transporter ExbD [Dokdonia sinensis]RMB58548.1 biopolymer transporter ExbD [Dokdonia sinensis]